MTLTVSTHESSCLAVYSPKCLLSPVLCTVSLSKNLDLVPVASSMTIVHRDRLVLHACSFKINAQWPEIQPIVFRGQIVSADLPQRTDRHTDGQPL